MEVRLVEGEADLHRICPVMLQLRPAFDATSLLAQIRQQMADGYRLAYVEDAGRVVCVAGFVITTKLACGRHVYIDDLVTDETVRSTGAGQAMMDWMHGYARAHGCGQIHLDSGVQRFAAHKFYLRHGFIISSHHFQMPVLPG